MVTIIVTLISLAIATFGGFVPLFVFFRLVKFLTIRNFYCIISPKNILI